MARAVEREQLLELVDDQHELRAVRRAGEQPADPPLQQLGVVLQLPGPRPGGRPHGRRQRIAQGGGEREERVAHLPGGREGGEPPVLAAGQGARAQPGQQAGVEQRGLAGAGIADDREEAAGRLAQARQQLVGLAAAAEEMAASISEMPAVQDRASLARAAPGRDGSVAVAGPDSLGGSAPEIAAAAVLELARRA